MVCRSGAAFGESWQNFTNIKCKKIKCKQQQAGTDRVGQSPFCCCTWNVTRCSLSPANRLGVLSAGTNQWQHGVCFSPTPPLIQCTLLCSPSPPSPRDRGFVQYATILSASPCVALPPPLTPTLLLASSLCTPANWSRKAAYIFIHKECSLS